MGAPTGRERKTVLVVWFPMQIVAVSRCGRHPCATDWLME